MDGGMRWHNSAAETSPVGSVYFKSRRQEREPLRKRALPPDWSWIVPARADDSLFTALFSFLVVLRRSWVYLLHEHLGNVSFAASKNAYT